MQFENENENMLVTFYKSNLNVLNAAKTIVSSTEICLCILIEQHEFPDRFVCLGDIF